MSLPAELSPYNRMHPFLASFVAGSAVVATSAGGSWFTRKNVDTPWYDCIRPTFAPPNLVFPIVWGALYLALAIAFTVSLCVDSSSVITLHVLNLVLNVIWCWAYFERKDVAGALGIIVGNVAVAVAIAAFTDSTLVRVLMTPYIAWLTFATALNVGSLTRLKRCEDVAL
jgi:benzodiazapine receptor